MEIDWIIRQITDVNIPTVLISICSSWGIKELVDWWKQRNLQSQYADMQKNLQTQKAEIDRGLELAKTECQREIQAHYLQTKLKIASIYKAFPDLFWALKETEGSVYQLFYHSFGDQNVTHKVWCALTKKMAEHSLFLDDVLRDACVKAKDTLMIGISTYDSIDEKAKKALMSTIHEQVDKVGDLMRAHLLKEGTKI